MQNALLVVAHGSRREASNDEVRALTQRLAAQSNGQFDAIACAFLELADPLIPAGIDDLVAQGASRIIVLPYFLSAGRHVAEDIPEIVEACRAHHADVEIAIAPYLGADDAVIPVLLSLAASEVRR